VARPVLTGRATLRSGLDPIRRRAPDPGRVRVGSLARPPHASY